ncbi:SCO3242 family prenyltransferase [Streptomyces sp. NPDC051320]|uniref:SCO3242 family prenyltransferase n=1 Tax=Streptomyces sp. NPDC051320 TaxID=3154644 RepID=UPI00341EFD09
MSTSAAGTTRALLELIRAPAALSVPGDVLAGAAAAHRPLTRSVAGLTASSVCLYWAGMALNDWADRELDAVERPERPIPSGRVGSAVALGVAGSLTAASLGLAVVSGGPRALAIAGPLAATVWYYDLRAKSGPAGPAVMAAARGLDVLLGAGTGRLRSALPAAATVAAHTLAVTVLSRTEVTGADPRLAGTMVAATGGVVLAAGRASGAVGRGGNRWHRSAAASALAVYGTTVGRAQLRAVGDPAPRQVRRAVGAGILGLIPLQAALTAGAGALRSALPVAAAFPVARALSRRVSPT